MREMEQAPAKKGYLYKPQKAIGLKKCWSKRWALLYPGSETQPPYLETFDSKESAAKEGSKCSTQVLNSYIQASPVTKRNRSREHAFEVTVDEKVIAYGVDTKEELDEWLEVIRSVCEGRPGKRNSTVPDLPQVAADTSSTLQQTEGLMENTLYDSYETMVFKIAIKPSAFSDSLNLQGSYLLQVDSVKLSLIEEDTGSLLYAWPYRYLRRYGRDKTSFSMEAGRKCDSGPGMIIFLTKEGNDIFHNIQNFVNNISGRHGIPSTQGQPGIDGHQPSLQRYEPVVTPPVLGKTPGTPPGPNPRSAAAATGQTDPIGAITENSIFKKKLAMRKDGTSSSAYSEDPTASYRKQPKAFQPKTKKEASAAASSKPPLPVRRDEPDPLYSEVIDKGVSSLDKVSPEAQYCLANDGDRPPHPVPLPEDSEYDELTTASQAMYNLPDRESRGERWREHGRTEDNIHTENYFHDSVKILQDEGDSSPDLEPAKPVSASVRHTHRPVPLPKLRQPAGSRMAKASEARRDPAPVDGDEQMYDSVQGMLGPPGSGSNPNVANGEDMYDHFVRPSLVHPVPAPRKISSCLTQQQQSSSAGAAADSDMELYDHLQRESGSGGSRMLPKPYQPAQRSFDQGDTYNTLVHEPQAGHGGVGSSLATAASLPAESQYTEAILGGDHSATAAGADETGLDENPYDVVAYQ